MQRKKKHKTEIRLIYGSIVEGRTVKRNFTLWEIILHLIIMYVMRDHAPSNNNYAHKVTHDGDSRGTTLSNKKSVTRFSRGPRALYKSTQSPCSNRRSKFSTSTNDCSRGRIPCCDRDGGGPSSDLWRASEYCRTIWNRILHACRFHSCGRVSWLR